MPDAGAPAAHLSDDEIDRYWKDALPEADVARVEHHYLDCLECRARVEVVEVLVRTLDDTPPQMPKASRSRRGAAYWPAAAAVLAAISLVAASQWARSAARERQLTARLDLRASPTVAQVNRTANVPVVLVNLAPPTRGDEMAMVTVPASGLIVFVLDAREAVAPGNHVSITLLAASRRSLLTLSDVASSAEGTVRVPVDAAVLPPGRYVLDVRGASGTASFPFVAERQ